MLQERGSLILKGIGVRGKDSVEGNFGSLKIGNQTTIDGGGVLPQEESEEKVEKRGSWTKKLSPWRNARGESLAGQWWFDEGSVRLTRVWGP